jgi:hypothetical protein
MKPFGLFLMRNRLGAAALVFVLAAVPFLNWLALIILALMTLRKGARDSFLLLILACIPSLVYALLGNNSILLYGLPALLALWLFGLVLRTTYSWSWVLLTATLVGVISVLCMHLYIGDASAWWQQKTLLYLQQLDSEMQVSSEKQALAIEHIANYGLGLQIAMLLLVNLVWLGFARFWQSVLFNPGQFQPEIYNIRLPVWAVVALMFIALMAFLTNLLDLLPLIGLCLLLAGLSVTHFILKTQKRSWIWIALLYISTIFLMQYFCVALAMIAICDSGLNLRQRVGKVI